MSFHGVNIVNHFSHNRHNTCPAMSIMNILVINQLIHATWHTIIISIMSNTQHNLGFLIGFYNYILVRHMRLLTSELLNPCHFTHLVTKDIQL